MIESILRVTGHGEGVNVGSQVGTCFGPTDRNDKGEYYMPGYFCHLAQAGDYDNALLWHEVSYWQRGAGTSEY